MSLLGDIPKINYQDQEQAPMSTYLSQLEYNILGCTEERNKRRGILQQLEMTTTPMKFNFCVT